MFNLKGVDIDRELVKGYFQYIQKRHAVYVNRFINGLPPPWTDDAILQKYKFCNVYRELDKGTIYYVENISKGRTGADLVFATIIYRIINNPLYFGYNPIPHLGDKTTIDSHITNMHEWVNGGNRLRSDAYLCNLPGKAKEVFRMQDAIYDLLGEEYMISLTQYLKRAVDLKSAWWVLRKMRVPGCGKFISYEIVCDLMLVGFLPFTENDWANAGPGALAMIEKMIPGANPLVAMQWLQLNQDKYLKEWPYKKLSLRSIEHNLCEFRKYKSLNGGPVRGKRRYYKYE
jgi:hypothetical protein